MVLLALLVLGAATQAGADVRVLSATLNRVDDGAPAAAMADAADDVATADAPGDAVTADAAADPVTQERRLATPLRTGDEVEVVIWFENPDPEPLEPGALVLTELLPEHMELVLGSARAIAALPVAVSVSYSVDGARFGDPGELTTGASDGDVRPVAAADLRALRWRWDARLMPAERAAVSYRLRHP